MKKIITTLLSLALSISVINITNATDFEKKYYKQIIITKTQIKNDYSEKYNEKISSIFTKYRYYKNKVTLRKLEILLQERIVELRSKSILSITEKKTLNLYLNLFYRTKLLLDYQLK